MATTWTSPDAVVDANRVRVKKGACTTGTEALAQGAAHAKDGISLAGLDSVTPHIEMAAASGTVTIQAGLANGDKTTIAGHDFVVAAVPVGDQFKLGASTTETAANLAAAVNASATAGIVGVVAATSAVAIVTIAAVAPGTAGNALTLTQTGGHMAVSGATLAGGTDIAANASLQASLLNPATGVWNRAPDLDLSVTAALGAQGLAGFQVTGPASRLQLLPNAVGAACSVYLIGHPRPLILGT